MGVQHHTPGIIVLVMLARERSLGTVYVPAIDAREGTLPGGVRGTPGRSLAGLVAHLRGEVALAPAPGARVWRWGATRTHPEIRSGSHEGRGEDTSRPWLPQVRLM